MSNKAINKVLAAGISGTEGEIMAKLLDALDLIERMNFAMVTAAGALEPLRDLDFHGKWRIHTALDKLQRISCDRQAELTYKAITSQGTPT